jgi:hypothetical protein
LDDRIFRFPEDGMRRRCLIVLLAGAALFSRAGAAHSGPCTAQIAKLKRQISQTASGPESGPTAPQTVGAQLHHQPTPGTVEHAEGTANKDADAALDRARKADAGGNAVACNKALSEARQLYGINQ